MRKLFVIIFAFLLSSTVVLAEAGKSCNKGDKLMKQLDLTEEQQEPVKKILEQQKEKRHALMESRREEMKKDMDAIHDETMQSLAGVLSTEQLQEYEALREARKEKREQRRQERKERWQQFKNVNDDRTDSNDGLESAI